MNKILRWPALKRSLQILSLTLATQVNLGCNWFNKGPLVLVVVIDGLKPTDVNCGSIPEARKTGFGFLCQEFQRVDGVVAPSTSRVANLASLLTGLDPDQIRVRTNDGILSSATMTLAEIFRNKGWRTSLHAGSVYVNRHNHIGQGFEYMGEKEVSSTDMPYLSIKATSQYLLNLLNEHGSSPFFSVLTIGTLLFPEVGTRTSTDELRSATIDSALEELSFSLGALFENLQKINRWENATVFILGNGPRNDGLLTKTENSYDVNPRKFLTPVFVKRPGQKADPEQLRVQSLWNFRNVHSWISEALKNSVAQPKEKEIDFFSQPSLSFSISENCGTGDLGPSSCRKVIIGEKTWLAWDKLLKIDSEEKNKIIAEARNSGLSDNDRWSSAEKKNQSSKGRLQSREFDYLFSSCLPLADLVYVRSSPCRSPFLALLNRVESRLESGDFDEIKAQKTKLRQYYNHYLQEKAWLLKNSQLGKFDNLSESALAEVAAIDKALQNAKLGEVIKDIEQ